MIPARFGRKRLDQFLLFKTGDRAVKRARPQSRPGHALDVFDHAWPCFGPLLTGPFPNCKYSSARMVESREMAIETEDDAIRFMRSVKFALRYNSTPSLPLASMYAAAKDQRCAIELTNVLLARDEVVETNVIAGRLVLVHHDVAPALYALRKRHRTAKLSGYAERAFRLIQDDGSASAGDVRRYLGVDGVKRPDPGDLALAELQREMLIDRGPSSVPKTGIPYLSKEGYPYRVFEKAHPDVVKHAKRMTVEAAIKTILQAAGPIPPKKLASMFKLCFSEEEMALAR